MNQTQNPITRLTNLWFEIEGVEKNRKAYGFIGKLKSLYGEEVVIQAINQIASRPTQAKNIKRPLEYLRGTCRNIVLQNPAPSSQKREEFQNMLKELI